MPAAALGDFLFAREPVATSSEAEESGVEEAETCPTGVAGSPSGSITSAVVVVDERNGVLLEPPPRPPPRPRPLPTPPPRPAGNGAAGPEDDSIGVVGAEAEYLGVGSELVLAERSEGDF